MSLLFLDEVAARLRVSYWSAREWVVTGKLRSVRLAGRRRIQVDESDLEAFIEASKIGGPEPGPKRHQNTAPAPQMKRSAKPVSDRPYEWMKKYEQQ